MNERTCGQCRYFRVTREREDDALGTCRLGKVMGVFRNSMRACPSFSVAGDPDPPVIVDAGRPRRSPARRTSAPGGGKVEFRVGAGALATMLGTLEPATLKLALRTLVELSGGTCTRELSRSWENGEFELRPADPASKAKSLGLAAFFHKLVMMRDNLRVLEQKVNAHAQLLDAEKVAVQQRITLSYQAVCEMGTAWLPIESVQADGLSEVVALLQTLVREIRCEQLERAPALAERWSGGEVAYLLDGEAHTEPLEVFYARLLVLRDRLYGLEELVGRHSHIGQEDAAAMGGYLRRCYGTLTSFNVLFRDRTDYFTSSR